MSYKSTLLPRVSSKEQLALKKRVKGSSKKGEESLGRLSSLD